MQTHAHPYSHTVGPTMVGDPLLRGHRGRNGCARIGKRHEKGVALRVNLLTPFLINGRAHEAVMLLEDAPVRAVADPLKELSGPLDIGKEEADRPGRQADHQPSPICENRPHAVSMIDYPGSCEP